MLYGIESVLSHAVMVGWKQIIAGARFGTGVGTGRGCLHFIGLFSDGNVHSHIDHLKAMILRARDEAIQALRIHVLLDGRKGPETSALD